jgi:predicted DNA-binding transcriptional regulator YafY
LPSKSAPTETMLEMIEYMREHPGLHKITDLAKRYKIHRATVARWCKSLGKRYGIMVEQTNFDFVNKKDTANFIPRGYIKLSPDSPEVLNISLTPTELDALMIAAERIKPLTPIVKQAISKLSKAKRIQNYKDKASILHTPIYDEYASDPSVILARVIEAIRDHQIAEVRYHNSKNQTTAYKFNSYALVPHHQHLYLIGISHPSIESGDNTVIRLRVDQIKNFKLTRDRFDDPEFDVVAYAAQDFGVSGGQGETQTIKVHFSAD